jgi:ATP-dependent protease ClpP protease subunit
MADINLYGPIGAGGLSGDDGISASAFASQVAEIDDGDALTVYLNSPGGSVFDGLTMYQSLVDRPGENHIVIRGVAASIASVIAMSGDLITMAQSSRLMIHNPLGPSAMAFGTAEDLREAAEDTLQTAQLLDEVRDTLVDVYAARTGQGRKQLLDWMSAETWMNAADAKKHGFADKVTPNKAVTATSYPQPLAVAIADTEELQRVVELARTLTMRAGPQIGAREAGHGRLRMAKARLRLTQ